MLNYLLSDSVEGQNINSPLSFLLAATRVDLGYMLQTLATLPASH